MNFINDLFIVKVDLGFIWKVLLRSKVDFYVNDRDEEEIVLPTKMTIRYRFFAKVPDLVNISIQNKGPPNQTKKAKKEDNLRSLGRN